MYSQVSNPSKIALGKCDVTLNTATYTKVLPLCNRKVQVYDVQEFCSH